MRRPWIKLEVATPDKPEICVLASKLRLDEDAVVGKLVRFWSWLAQNRLAGDDLGVTLEFVDRLTGRRGFGQAMLEVRWLERDDQGRLSVPHFDRHNSEVARTRALTKQRVAKHRALKNSDEPKPKRGRPPKVAATTRPAPPQIEPVKAQPVVEVSLQADRPEPRQPSGKLDTRESTEGKADGANPHWLDQPMLF